MTINPALSHRATVARLDIKTEGGRSVKRWRTVHDSLPCFVSDDGAQERQADTTPTTPTQRTAKIFLVNGSAGVGDRLTLTRPAGLGTYEIKDITPIFDGYAAHHIEASCIEVKP